MRNDTTKTVNIIGFPIVLGADRSDVDVGHSALFAATYPRCFLLSLYFRSTVILSFIMFSIAFWITRNIPSGVDTFRDYSKD